MRIDPASPEHPYRQLAAQLRERIERGEITRPAALDHRSDRADRLGGWHCAARHRPPRQGGPGADRARPRKLREALARCRLVVRRLVGHVIASGYAAGDRPVPAASRLRLARRTALAWLPAHDDLAGCPDVAVSAFRRVGPPPGPLHVHPKIRTRVRWRAVGDLPGICLLRRPRMAERCQGRLRRPASGLCPVPDGENAAARMTRP